jgi:hypothetical protein
MWRVVEGSPWSPLTAPGRTILTTEPHIADVRSISADSWLWYELGFKLDIHRYDGASLHHPTIDSYTGTTLIVWTRPGVGDTEEQKTWRNESRRLLLPQGRHE